MAATKEWETKLAEAKATYQQVEASAKPHLLGSCTPNITYETFTFPNGRSLCGHDVKNEDFPDILQIVIPVEHIYEDGKYVVKPSLPGDISWHEQKTIFYLALTSIRQQTQEIDKLRQEVEHWKDLFTTHVKGAQRFRYQQSSDIVDKLIKDLTDRKGLSREWYEIDDETQSMIRSKWIEIVDEERPERPRRKRKTGKQKDVEESEPKRTRT